jgi:hypothetical protein
MPERWQHELRKLNRLEPTPGLWDRAMAGPRREHPRPQKPWPVIAPVAAALAVVVVAGAVALVRDLEPMRRAMRPGGGYPAAFVAAVGRGIRSGPSGLAVFSSSDGRLLRWLVRGAADPVPVAVSPDGRWLYYYDQGVLTRGRCPATGFTDPVLWKVPTGGGRPERAGLRTPSIAFSTDGRMVAYTASSDCGRVARIVVRDRRTGAIRRILLARNDLSGQPTFSAQLSWAPDDAHLAVAVAPAAAINTLSVLNARRATSAITARQILPCPGTGGSGCLDPSFGAGGRLTFLKWQEGTVTSFAEWVIRWQHSRAEQLFPIPPRQAEGGGASIAVDRAGNAVLIEGGMPLPEIWRWYRGHLSLILRSTPNEVLSNPLWLP